MCVGKRVSEWWNDERESDSIAIHWCQKQLCIVLEVETINPAENHLLDNVIVIEIECTCARSLIYLSIGRWSRAFVRLSRFIWFNNLDTGGVINGFYMRVPVVNFQWCHLPEVILASIAIPWLVLLFAQRIHLLTTIIIIARRCRLLSSSSAGDGFQIVVFQPKHNY